VAKLREQQKGDGGRKICAIFLRLAGLKNLLFASRTFCTPTYTHRQWRILVYTCSRMKGKNWQAIHTN